MVVILPRDIPLNLYITGSSLGISFMGAWIHFLHESAIVNFFFALCNCMRGKITKKISVLATTTLKSMVAEAPILTGTLHKAIL